MQTEGLRAHANHRLRGTFTCTISVDIDTVKHVDPGLAASRQGAPRLRRLRLFRFKDLGDADPELKATTGEHAGLKAGIGYRPHFYAGTPNPIPK